MKILTVLGTRPEIIRLSRVIPLLDSFCKHVLVHTGQNYEPALKDVFFADLGLRSPDYSLNCQSDTTMGQIGMILAECEKVMISEKPDCLLVLGDTNSALAAMVAKRMGIMVCHMEAGNRCYDDRVPEEINRRIVDHCSDVLMPYTNRSRANLLREGVPGHRIFVTGNPIYEVLEHYSGEIENSRALETMGVRAGQYFLVTLHRAENVDIEERLNKFIKAFLMLGGKYRMPLICSLHPRTRSRIIDYNLAFDKKSWLQVVEPLGLFDFVKLEKNALCVLSDSGTVQEECCIFGIPGVTLRDVTERPETLEAGSNLLSGCEPQDILNAVRTVLCLPKGWEPPAEYLVRNVSNAVVKIVVGKGNTIGR